jgi:hypothetical protein
MKDEFKSWLKDYWDIFYGTTFAEVYVKIVHAINEYNLQNPSSAQSYINYIPSFEGKIRHIQKPPQLKINPTSFSY